MKKTFTILTMLAVLAGLCACGGQAGPKPLDSGKDLVYNAGENTDWPLPKINLDCPEAAWINDEIARASATQTPGEDCRSSFTWSVNGDILSLVFWWRGGGDFNYTYMYALNKKTGARVSNRELLEAAGITKAAFYERARMQVKLWYESVVRPQAEALAQSEPGVFPDYNDVLERALALKTPGSHYGLSAEAPMCLTNDCRVCVLVTIFPYGDGNDDDRLLVIDGGAGNTFAPVEEIWG